MADAKFTCESCRFWQDKNIIGVCRRYPHNYNKHRSEWCGEHSQHPTAEPVKRKYVRKQNADTAA